MWVTQQHCLQAQEATAAAEGFWKEHTAACAATQPGEEGGGFPNMSLPPGGLAGVH